MTSAVSVQADISVVASQNCHLRQEERQFFLKPKADFLSLSCPVSSGPNTQRTLAKLESAHRTSYVYTYRYPKFCHSFFVFPFAPYISGGLRGWRFGQFWTAQSLSATIVGFHSSLCASVLRCSTMWPWQLSKSMCPPVPACSALLRAKCKLVGSHRWSKLDVVQGLVTSSTKISNLQLLEQEHRSSQGFAKTLVFVGCIRPATEDSMINNQRNMRRIGRW